MFLRSFLFPSSPSIKKEEENILTIDDREITEHPELLSEIKLPYVVNRLEAADYAFLDRHGEPTGVERSEIGNLIQKLRSGELESQLEKCSSNYEHIILLKEGVYDSNAGLLAVYRAGNRGYFKNFVYPHTYYENIKAMEIRLSELGVELLDSPNFSCSITIIRTIYVQRTKPESWHTLFKPTRSLSMPTKLTNDPSVGRMMGLCPRMGEKVGIRLIHRFGSIWGVLHATDKELLEVEGMGKTLVKHLKEAIGKDVA